MEMLPSSLRCPVAPLAMVFIMEGFFHGEHNVAPDAI
jgi:hypothetical protein